MSEDLIVEVSAAEGPTDRKQAAIPIHPRRWRTHLRKEAADRWRVIVRSLLSKAEEGSVPHIALLAKLAGFEQGPMPPPEPKRRTKSLAQQLREEMEELDARNIAEFGE